eukprot:1036424-Pelagomonas_calceolata.AAC.2
MPTPNMLLNSAIEAMGNGGGGRGGYWTGCLKEVETQAWKDGRQPVGSTLSRLLASCASSWWDSLFVPALTPGVAGPYPSTRYAVWWRGYMVAQP